MARIATAEATQMSVAFGTPKRVRGPLVTLLQLVMIVCSTTSSAKEVITAAASERRISGQEKAAATSPANRPATAMARSGWSWTPASTP